MCTFGLLGCGVKPRRKKKREILGPPTLRGPHPSGPHPSGPHPSGPHPSGPTLRGPILSGFGPHPLGHDTHQIQKWIGQNWIDQNWSNQDGQNGIGESRSLLGGGTPPKKCHSEGAGVDLPECQERRRQAQKHKKVSVSLKASPAFGQGRFHQKKNTDFFVLLCLPASFLTFGKVNPGPPQCFCACPGVVFDIREGQPRPPSDLPTPPSFLSAPGPPQTDILLGGGVPSPPPPHFCQRRPPPSD